MLKSIEIESLFNLYSYTVVLSDENSPYVRFITGPNGFGKTSILNIINDIYNRNFEALSHIPFKKVKLVYGDETEITVVRQVRTEQIDESDEKETVDIIFDIEFRRLAEGLHDEIRCSRSNGFLLPLSTNLENYLGSMPIYYVMDNRLLSKDNWKPSVEKKASDLAVRLTDLKSKYSACIVNFLSSGLSDDSGGAAGRVEKIRGYLELLSDLNFLRKSGDDANPFRSCEHYIGAIESFIENEKSTLDKILAFQSVIEQFAFANKKLQMNEARGFRFIADDSDHTILSADKLSSGEQHIVILAYDLLFESADDSIFLIDEPELSFHLSWQGEFLSAIKKIVDVRKIQCIFATHSAQIFQHQWQISSDLFMSQKH